GPRRLRRRADPRPPGPPCRGPGRRRGPGRPRPLGADAMGALIPVRDDLDLMAGYHSPQVTVDVRLNTNESPLPPPRAWLDALHGEIDAIAFNRYPDRSAAGLRQALAELHGVRPDQVLAANGSNEALQLLFMAY